MPSPTVICAATAAGTGILTVTIGESLVGIKVDTTCFGNLQDDLLQVSVDGKKVNPFLELMSIKEEKTVCVATAAGTEIVRVTNLFSLKRLKIAVNESCFSNEAVDYLRLTVNGRPVNMSQQVFLPTNLALN